MTITTKEKELAAVGISVAAGCKPCTDFHLRKGRETGASDAEIKQAIIDALSARRSAADIMETYGLAHLEGREPESDLEHTGTTDRVRELVSIGAAFGVNCVSSLKVHLDAAERAGISHEEIAMIVKLSAFIKGKAASHVEHLAESFRKPEVIYEQEVSACC
ncbi:carboxymuconolactone decarboxylase family protein [Bradyrhizobium liaoningense]|uniref:carboxymuconolactone decarboxylase family protein n=1 Tax=Bradyrhizobium liaoningense TaxID=43992 RepID=UPI001BA848D9|nr:carboxymuconolactone decarboxylase family protein [Bradyrhizobium liaoningense]MBR0716945.1 carboxymuconolactone decarboxylase family protein [Bradyrhizobium liaoningense]